MNQNLNTLILMSTYNGEKFLREQLNSLIAQDYIHWTLLIRDDGSSDQTRAIINEYINKDSRIQLVTDNDGNLKPARSFSALMEIAVKREESYIFFCDQDDIWLPEKLSLSKQLFTDLEKNNEKLPLLIHSDLKVVNASLELIHSSYLQYEKLTRNPLNPMQTLLVNNYITGCTVGINRPLLILATPVPPEAFMHDWWCALWAAAVGKIGFISQPTLLYRQHDSNSVGSGGFNQKFYELLDLRKNFARRRREFNLRFLQASALAKRLDSSTPYFSLVKNFSELSMLKGLKKYWMAKQLALKPSSIIRKYIFWILLFFACKDSKPQ